MTNATSPTLEQTPNASPAGATNGLLAYTAQQLCAAIQIDQVTLWRLEKKGRLQRISGLGHRRYAIEEVRRFLRAA